MDDDNEVRDRATFYLNVLEQKQKALNAGYILNGNTESPQNKTAPLLVLYTTKRWRYLQSQGLVPSVPRFNSVHPWPGEGSASVYPGAL